MKKRRRANKIHRLSITKIKKRGGRRRKMRKEKNIVYFKRGFGEHSWPLKRWVWFRNPQNELEYLQQAVNNYTKCFE